MKPISNRSNPSAVESVFFSTERFSNSLNIWIHLHYLRYKSLKLSTRTPVNNVSYLEVCKKIRFDFRPDISLYRNIEYSTFDQPSVECRIFDIRSACLRMSDFRHSIGRPSLQFLIRHYTYIHSYIYLTILIFSTNSLKFILYHKTLQLKQDIIILILEIWINFTQ